MCNSPLVIYTESPQLSCITRSHAESRGVTRSHAESPEGPWTSLIFAYIWPNVVSRKQHSRKKSYMKTNPRDFAWFCVISQIALFWIRDFRIRDCQLGLFQPYRHEWRLPRARYGSCILHALWCVYQKLKCTSSFWMFFDWLARQWKMHLLQGIDEGLWQH